MYTFSLVPSRSFGVKKKFAKTLERDGCVTWVEGWEGERDSLSFVGQVRRECWDKKIEKKKKLCGCDEYVLGRFFWLKGRR